REKKHRSRAEKGRRRHEGGPPEGRERHQPRRGAKSGQRTRVGRVQKNPRGFAFLIPVEAGFSDVYVSPGEAAPLMNDDVVEFTVERRGRRDQARIERILKRGQTAILGEVRAGARGPILQTETGEIHELDGARAKDVGQWVIANIEEYPTDEHPGLVSIKEH